MILDIQKVVEPGRWCIQMEWLKGDGGTGFKRKVTNLKGSEQLAHELMPRGHSDASASDVLNSSPASGHRRLQASGLLPQ